MVRFITKLDGHGRARREAARRRKSECKINLSPRYYAADGRVYNIAVNTIEVG